VFSVDDLTVELDAEAARHLHRCWQATQQRHWASAARPNTGMLAFKQTSVWH